MPNPPHIPPRPLPAAAAVQTSAPKALPPVPGGGSWRVNATGDGWIENKPEPAQAADTASTTSKQPE